MENPNKIPKVRSPFGFRELAVYVESMTYCGFHELTVGEFHTVRDLKQMLSEEMCGDVSEYHLFYAGEELADHVRLQAMFWQDAVTLHMVRYRPRRYTYP